MVFLREYSGVCEVNRIYGPDDNVCVRLWLCIIRVIIVCGRVCMCVCVCLVWDCSLWKKVWFKVQRASQVTFSSKPISFKAVQGAAVISSPVLQSAWRSPASSLCSQVTMAECSSWSRVVNDQLPFTAWLLPNEPLTAWLGQGQGMQKRYWMWKERCLPCHWLSLFFSHTHIAMCFS